MLATKSTLPVKINTVAEIIDMCTKCQLMLLYKLRFVDGAILLLSAKVVESVGLEPTTDGL